MAQNNIKDFYKAEIEPLGSFGSEQEFAEFISDPKNAKDFFEAEFKESGAFANADEFVNFLGIEKKNLVGNKPTPKSGTGGTVGDTEAQSIGSEFKPTIIGQTKIDGEEVDVFSTPQIEVRASKITDDLKQRLKGIDPEAMKRATKIKLEKREPTPQELQSLLDMGISEAQLAALKDYLSTDMSGKKKATQEDVVPFLKSLQGTGENIGTRMQGFIPRLNIVAADVWENVFGKELAQKWYKWEGRDIDKVRKDAYNKLSELEGKMMPTRGLVESFKKGDIGGLAAAVVDATGAIISTAIPSALTGGAGLFTEMIGESVVDYNNTKAIEKGISTKELYDKGEAELAVPLAVGTLSGGLEKLGLKGITSAINKKIQNVGTKKVAELFLDYNKEGMTEFVQTGLEEANKVLAKGGTITDAANAAADVMLSEKGLEAYAMGVTGAASSGTIGRYAKSKYQSITGNRNKELGDISEKAQDIIANIENPNVAPETKQTLVSVLDNLDAEANKIIEEEKKKFDELSDEDKEKVKVFLEQKRNFENGLKDPNLTEESKKIFEDSIEQIDNNLSAIFKNEPTTTVSEPIQQITAEPQPQVEEGVTETVSEGIVEDSGGGAKATPTVLEEAKPIRQLGTGANVYFETNKYRVNDNLKNGKILLNVGDANSEIPLANIEFDNPQEAVKIAEALDRDFPNGIPDYIDAEKYVQATKEQLLTPKTEQDAVQEQTAGQVPVQPEARISEEVEEGTPETKPKEVAKEEEVKPKRRKLTESEKEQAELYKKDRKDLLSSEPNDFFDFVMLHFLRGGKVDLRDMARELGFYRIDKKTGEKKLKITDTRPRVAFWNTNKRKKNPSVTDIANQLVSEYENDYGGAPSEQDARSIVIEVLSNYATPSELHSELANKYRGDDDNIIRFRDVRAERDYYAQFAEIPQENQLTEEELVELQNEVVRNEENANLATEEELAEMAKEYDDYFNSLTPEEQQQELNKIKEYGQQDESITTNELEINQEVSGEQRATPIGKSEKTKGQQEANRKQAEREYAQELEKIDKAIDKAKKSKQNKLDEISGKPELFPEEAKANELFGVKQDLSKEAIDRIMKPFNEKIASLEKEKADFIANKENYLAKYENQEGIDFKEQSPKEIAKKNLIDQIQDLKIKGGDKTGVLMLAPKLWNGFLDAIILGIKAGKLLENAVKDGIKFLKDNGVDNVTPYIEELQKSEDAEISKAATTLIKRAYKLGEADTAAKFKAEIKKIKKDIKDANLKISDAVKEIRKSIRDSKLKFNERQVSKLIGIVDEINANNINQKLDEINDYIDSIEDAKTEKERKDLAQELIKAINPKSYEIKGTSKRAKTKISDEAKQNLINLAKSIGDQIETMTLPQLKQLEQIIDDIVEQGKSEQRAMQDLLKKIRKEKSREMTQILADKAESTTTVNSKNEAIERLNRGDKIVINDVVFSKSDISDLESMPDSFFNNTKVLIIPKANQFGRFRPKWNSFIYRKTDLITMLRNALPSTKRSQDWVIENVIDPIISASNKTLSLKVEFGDKMKDMKERVFGKGWISKSSKYLSKPTGLELKDIDGRDLVEGGMNNDEAVYMYNIMKDPLMIDKALNAGFSIEQLIKIAEYVRNDAKLKQYAEEVNKLYSSYLPQVNDALINAEMTSIVPGEYGDLSKISAEKLSVLEAVYGDVSLIPEQIPYSPAQVKGIGDTDFDVNDLFSSGKNAASIIAGNVIERKAQGQLLIVPNETAMEAYRQNMLNMISKLPLYKEMFSMFREGGENMDLIRSIYGDKFAQTFKANLQDVMLEKNNTAKNQNNFIYNYIDRQAALIMMLNLRSAAFQALSAPNFYIDAVKDGVLFETVKNTFFRGGKVSDAAFETKESGWFRDRIDKTFSAEIQDLRNAKDRTKFGKALDDVLSKGYVLTKVMDSYVGINLVGVPYYSALKDKYYAEFKKEMSDAEAMEKAQEKAMTKFSYAANKTQQSSNPSFMSEDQKDRFSRMFLTFGSVNLLYTREMLRAASDFKNGRVSAKNAVGTIAYYTLLQQGIFLALQTGLAAIATGIAGVEDDEEEIVKQKSLTVANQSFNAILRGFGVYGAIVAAIKDTAFDIAMYSGRKEESVFNDLYEMVKEKQLVSEQGKAKSDSQLLLNSIGNAIPNLSIKIKKIQRAIREDDRLKSAMAGVEAATNIPTTQVNRIMDMIADLQNDYFSITEKMLRLIDQLPYERLKELRDKAEKDQLKSSEIPPTKSRTREVKQREANIRESSVKEAGVREIK